MVLNSLQDSGIKGLIHLCVHMVSRDLIMTVVFISSVLIAAKSKKEITTLKAQLSSEFEMKDLGVAKKY
jgi:hypothetical protein